MFVDTAIAGLLVSNCQGGGDSPWDLLLLFLSGAFLLALLICTAWVFLFRVRKPKQKRKPKPLELSRPDREMLEAAPLKSVIIADREAPRWDYDSATLRKLMSVSIHDDAKRIISLRHPFASLLALLSLAAAKTARRYPSALSLASLRLIVAARRLQRRWNRDPEGLSKMLGCDITFSRDVQRFGWVIVPLWLVWRPPLLVLRVGQRLDSAAEWLEQHCFAPVSVRLEWLLIGPRLEETSQPKETAVTSRDLR